MPSAQAAGSSPAQTMNASQANMAARQLILARAIEMKQQVYSSTFNPAQQPTINIQPRYAGLIRKFIVFFSATIANNDGALRVDPHGFWSVQFPFTQFGLCSGGPE